MRAHPHITVLVHERGAKHMIDPSRLLDSATRLYGDDMDRLWGEFAAVPQTNDGVAGRRGTGRRRRADLRGRLHAGPRVASRELLRSRQPAWRSSATSPASASPEGMCCRRRRRRTSISSCGARASDRILAWSPSTLFLTHFGPVTRVRPHLAELLDNLAHDRRRRARIARRPGDATRRRASVLRSGCDRNCGGR